MTKVFYADRKKRSKTDKNSPDSAEFPPVHAGTSWIDSMGYVFWFLRKWMKLRLYVLFNLLPLPLREGIAGALGQIFLGFSKSNRFKVESAFRVLYPNIKLNQMLRRFYFAHCAYLGKLFFDFMNGLPKNIDLPIKQFIKFEHLDLLYRELEKRKGVIVPTTHLGQLVHVIYAFSKLPERIPVATVIYTPHLITYQFTNRVGYDHIFLYASTSFSKISKYLVNHLRQNHIVVIYYDFGTPRQLRVPMWPERFPYLINTPQSVVNLHRKTGASILPCLNTPDRYIHYSRLKFCENQSLMNISAKIRHQPVKIIHGRLSLEINRIIYPTIERYAHVWEQIPDLATARLADELLIPEKCNLWKFMNLIIEKMRQIIMNSFELHRNDSMILETCEKMGNLLKKNKKSLLHIMQESKKINLSWMNTHDEFRILINELLNSLSKQEFTELNQSMKSLWQELDRTFYDPSASSNSSNSSF